MISLRDAFQLRPIHIHDDFHDYRFSRNLRIVFWVCVGIVVLTTSLLFTLDVYNYTNDKWANEPLFKTIAILRFCLLVSLSFILWPQRNRDWKARVTKRDRILNWVLIAYILAWCLVTSIIGSAIHGQIIIIIIALLTGGMVLIINPKEAIWTFGITLVGMIAGLLYLDSVREIASTTGNIVGVSTAAVVAFFVAVFNYRRTANNFSDRQTIVSQQERLEVLNADIGALLKEREQELSDFIYRSSHDLRAPVVELKGLWEIFRYEENLPALHQNYIKEGAKHTRSLEGYVRNLVGIMENRRQPVDLDTFDAHALIHETISQLVFLDGEIEPHIEVDITTTKHVRGDRYRTWLMLSNLLDNAVRFQRRNEPSPSIRILMKESDERLILEVEDNGAGMSSEFRKNIWKRFSRGDKGNVGAGLGLYVVKEIVEMLGGEFEIQSEEGKGTIFTLQFPIAIS